MALAYTYDEELWESPWPKPRLALVTAPEDPDEDPDGEPAPAAVVTGRWAAGTPAPELETSAWAVRQGEDVTSRRARRARLQVRRRRAAVLALTAGLLAVLALPLSELAAKPATTVPAFASVNGAKVTYVVQSGDDVQSIADRFTSGHGATVLAGELEAELGTNVVVPGEHVAIP